MSHANPLDAPSQDGIDMGADGAAIYRPTEIPALSELAVDTYRPVDETGPDGDSGGTLPFAGSKAAVAGLHYFTVPIAAKGRIYVAGDNVVVAYGL